MGGVNTLHVKKDLRLYDARVRKARFPLSTDSARIAMDPRPICTVSTAPFLVAMGCFITRCIYRKKPNSTAHYGAVAFEQVLFQVSDGQRIQRGTFVAEPAVGHAKGIHNKTSTRDAGMTNQINRAQLIVATQGRKNDARGKSACFVEFPNPLLIPMPSAKNIQILNKSGYPAPAFRNKKINHVERIPLLDQWVRKASSSSNTTLASRISHKINILWGIKNVLIQ